MLQVLKNIPRKTQAVTDTIGASAPFRTRSFLKIQDGCQNFCSYCIVPFVRRCENSVPPGTIIEDINQRTNEGYQEVVLTGTRVGGYALKG